VADRVGRRAVIRSGFAGAVVFLGLFVQTQDRDWALAFLIPLAVFIFLPRACSSCLVRNTCRGASEWPPGYGWDWP